MYSGNYATLSLAAAATAASSSSSCHLVINPFVLNLVHPFFFSFSVPIQRILYEYACVLKKEDPPEVDGKT